MGNQGLAFGLVFASGAATFLGALGILFSKRELDKRFLSVSLAASAGVMIYVSFVEILCVKAFEGFVESHFSEAEARRYSSLLFFAGILATVGLDKISHYLAGRKPGHHASTDVLESIKEKSSMHFQGEEGGGGGGGGGGAEIESKDVENNHHRVEAGGGTGTRTDIKESTTEESGEEEEQLQKAGLITALAIGLHNFPEGLATYMATLADSSAGIAVAVAIALHNIPEGLAVAMPVYYGTGSKRKGITWGILSGVSEPLGGLFGYLVLKGTDMDPLSYAILFSVVSGMMVYISFAELLPNALMYDKTGHSTTMACFIGMGIMSASLLLFEV